MARMLKKCHRTYCWELGCCMPILLSTSANIIHDQIALKSIADTVKETLVICIAQMRPYNFFFFNTLIHAYFSLNRP